jgi:phosphate starvation-inducible PhoH-like protein
MSRQSRAEKLTAKRDRRESVRAATGAGPLSPPKTFEQVSSSRINQMLNAKTEAQGHYKFAIESSQLVFGIGPAGTGKTHICTVMALKALLDKRVGQIIITRPMVTAGKGAGFLPGELDEKFAPFFEPIRQIIQPLVGASHFDNLIRNEKLVARPLDYIRGLTFDNAFVILDEAQNTTPEQMKLFLTRIGENSSIVVNGDISQSDLPGLSGLQDALDRLRGMDGCTISEFTEDDVVRSGIVRSILKRYRNPS